MSMSIMLRNSAIKSSTNWTLVALHLRHKIILRLSSNSHGGIKRQKPQHKTEMIGAVKGSLLYEKDLTENTEKGQIQYGSLWGYFINQASHATELWPLYGLLVCSALLLISIFYISFNRIEVWLDRSVKEPPYAYSRVLEGNKVKGTKQIFDYTGVMDERLPIVDELHKVMLAKAKERGTR